ncbi:conserved hypothetical protein, possible membrane protein [Aurantimonas manganoxydans SI85-9A1]|uniref:Uncharacterized protein n=1 Tax=Aurantimonas manganoxydans (strain ATCC BAA-1229 / DSM 21871 / SI85-9A1) TaxID=287752 RepID=Q1YJS0_AURMS|nr:conserved hypothetical protein, possible membrane protein [Aurantimonas manganoxydans SI85-9A1]
MEPPHVSNTPALPQGFEIERRAAKTAPDKTPRLPAGFQLQTPPTATPQAAEGHHLRRSTLLPLAKNTQTGGVEWAAPQVALDIVDAIMLPGDVYQGNVDPLSDEGMSRTLNLAGIATGGALTTPTRKLIDEAGRAVPKAVVRGLRDDGIPAADAGRRIRELGPDGVVADLGANLRDKTAAIATAPGKGQRVITDRLRERQLAAPDRLTGALDETLGAAPIPSYVQRSIRDDQRALGPAYEDALAGAQAVDTSALAGGIDAMVPNLRGKAQTALQSVRGMLNATGTGDLDPSPATLFQVRRAIDGMLKDEADSNVRRVLGDVRAQVDGLLADAAPGIKQVDARYSELARQGDAVDRGQTVLGSGRNDPRPAELADEAAAGAVPSGEIIGPSGVAFRLRQGARAEIDRIVGTNLNDRAALNSLLKGNSDWNRQRLTTLFGAERTDRLYRILENERAMADTENRALTGSKTASLQAAQKEIDGPAKRPGVVRSAANLRLGDASAELIDAIFGGAINRQRAGRNLATADSLMSRGDFRRGTADVPLNTALPYTLLLDTIMGDK